jgi:hypothetical protein
MEIFNHILKEDVNQKEEIAAPQQNPRALSKFARARSALAQNGGPFLGGGPLANALLRRQAKSSGTV